VLFLLRRPGAELVSHHGLEVVADAPAAECIVCHDGFTATYITMCVDGCNVRNTHPVLRDYPPSGKERDYTPLETISAQGVVLEDGKITCVSCHELRNNSRCHLRFDNYGSGLCFSCHNK
jgi:hypothetical protein